VERAAPDAGAWEALDRTAARTRKGAQQVPQQGSTVKAGAWIAPFLCYFVPGFFFVLVEVGEVLGLVVVPVLVGLGFVVVVVVVGLGFGAM
jgi:hypothetical protein